MYLPDDYEEFIINLTLKYQVPIYCYTEIKREEMKVDYEVYFSKMLYPIEGNTHYVIWVNPELAKGFIRVGTYDEIMKIVSLTPKCNCEQMANVPAEEVMADTSECVTEADFNRMWHGK